MKIPVLFKLILLQLNMVQNRCNKSVRPISTKQHEIYQFMNIKTASSYTPPGYVYR